MPQSGYNALSFGGGRFVALKANTNLAAYSIDGETWTETTLPVSLNWVELAYGNGVFASIVAYSDVGIYSTDGITWYTSTTPSSSERWRGLEFANGRFLIGGMGSDIAESSDGINWTKFNDSCGYSQYVRASSVGVNLVITRESSEYAFYSTNNGSSWDCSLMPLNGLWYVIGGYE